MCATGSGIAPFLSQLKSVFLWKRFKRIVLVHSVSYQNELISAELVDELHNYPEIVNQLIQLQFVPVVTREKTSKLSRHEYPS